MKLKYVVDIDGSYKYLKKLMKKKNMKFYKFYCIGGINFEVVIHLSNT